MRINFDFSDLEAFLAVKDTGSFHLAAERLNLSQSAVTRRVQKLETVLGTELFERTTRAVKPTLAAKRLQARAEAILEDAAETARTMRDDSVAFAHQRGAVITVATIPTVVGCLLTPAIADFRQQGFTSRIRILDSAANQVAEAVAQGEADFGIGAIPLLEPNTDFQTLFVDPLGLYVAADHDWAGRDYVTWQDLDRQALILPAKGTGNRLMIDEAMAKAHLPMRWTFEVARSSTALGLVAGGVGIAILPRSLGDGIKGQNVRFVALRGPDVSRPVGVMTRLGQSDSPAVAALKAALGSIAVQRL